MIKLKLNLTKLTHVVMKKKGKNGEVEGIFIPIKQNHLFKSEKTGSVYFDLVAFPIKKPTDDQTHLVKQSFNKEQRAEIGEEKLKELPILGGLNNMESGGGQRDEAPTGNPEPDKTFSEDEDLPF